MSVLAWVAADLLGLALFVLVVEPWLRGRLPSDRYHAHLRSGEWAETCRRLERRRRGRRCAACGTTTDLGQPHHVVYTNLGFESLWQLVRLCKRHHVGRFGVHWWAEWLFSSRTRGLVLTTALVCGYGKAKRLGHRTPRRTTIRRAA